MGQAKKKRVHQSIQCGVTDTATGGRQRMSRASLAAEMLTAAPFTFSCIYYFNSALIHRTRYYNFAASTHIRVKPFDARWRSKVATILNFCHAARRWVAIDLAILYFHSSALSFRVFDQIYVCSSRVPKEAEPVYYNPSSPMKPQDTDNDMHTNVAGESYPVYVTCIQNTDDTKFTEMPINVAIAATCPDTNSKQISNQWSEICTGRQHFPLPITYQPHHMNHSSDLQLKMPNSLHIQQPAAGTPQAQNDIDVPYYFTDLDRGSWSFNYHDQNRPKELCECTQETQRPGPQELVLNSSKSIKFWNHPSTFTCTTSMEHELIAFEREDLYIKPFHSLQPS